MDRVNQSGNVAGRDIIAGDNVTNAPRRTPVTELNERYLAADGTDGNLTNFIEKLQHYWNAPTNGDIRTLRQKLVESERADFVALGEELKERATKIIFRYQTSKTGQELLTHILTELFGKFVLEVTASIQSGADRVTVDSLFSEKVIGSTLDSLEANPLGLDRFDLMGLIYFLTGNCHIRWDRC